MHLLEANTPSTVQLCHKQPSLYTLNNASRIICPARAVQQRSSTPCAMLNRRQYPWPLGLSLRQTFIELQPLLTVLW